MISYVRSDHLKAVLAYVLEMAKISEIPVLDFGDNENALNFEEQIEEMESMLKTIEEITEEGSRDLNVLERNSLRVLLLDSMVMQFRADATLDRIKDDILNDRCLLGVDEELIEDVYEDFKKIKENEK